MFTKEIVIDFKLGSCTYLSCSFHFLSIHKVPSINLRVGRSCDLMLKKAVLGKLLLLAMKFDPMTSFLELQFQMSDEPSQSVRPLSQHLG